MLTENFTREIAGLEAGYLNHLGNLRELERIETTFETISITLTKLQENLNCQEPPVFESNLIHLTFTIQTN